MRNLKRTINTYGQRKFFKFGVPFLIFIVGGSFGLQYFTQIKYDFAPKQTVNPEEVEKLGIKMKKSGEVTLETEYEKIKSIDLDNWDNKRGPRPWEEKPILAK